MASAVLLNPVAQFESMASTAHRAMSSSSSAKVDASNSTSSTTFHRIKTSLEQSLRRGRREDKGKEKHQEPQPEKPRGLKRFESKMTFRLGPKNDPGKATTSKPSGSSANFVGSLRGASMSSPALHLQASPDRRTRRVSIQPTPSVLSKPRRDPSSSSSHLSRGPSSRHHRLTQSQPVNILTSPSTPALLLSRQLAPTPETPSLPTTPEPPSPPETPTPTRSRSRISVGTSRRAAASSGHLPSSAGSPSVTPRTMSPIRPRDPSTPTRSRVAPRAASSSSSHLPLAPPSPSMNIRGSMDGRPSLDSPRRPSFDAPRRPSLDSPSARASFESTRRSSAEFQRRPSVRNESPSPSPHYRNAAPRSSSATGYRQMNVSTSSLTAAAPNPEAREAIRTATSMFLHQVAKPPIHIGRNESARRDWEEVEVKTRALARLERIWGKSGAKSGASMSATNLNNIGALSSSGLSAAGEERERKLFVECLRDGFVLCQLMNKLRQSSIVKPDPREDGFARTSNVTKFLAACASYGLPSEELFGRDDLIEATSESLHRVAKTIIALIKYSESPQATRSKVILGQAKRLPTSVSINHTNHPYATRVAGLSTPNLTFAQRSPSPNTSPSKPQQSFAKVHENTDHSNPSDRVGGEGTGGGGPVPPKSPLRRHNISSRKEDDGGLFNWAKSAASPGRSVSSSAAVTTPTVSTSSFSADPNDATLRQSVAVSDMTESTTTTTTTTTSGASSLLEMGRSMSSGWKFGTIRTVTTEATSVEDSSPTTSSSAGVVDLTYVAEEEGSGRTTPAEQHPKAQPVKLGKGKWPDDFLDAFQNSPPARGLTPPSSPSRFAAGPLSASPPRKLAIVDRSTSGNESAAVPRRPSHRARHSIDVAGGSTTTSSSLLPKENVGLGAMRRDVSPDLRETSRVVPKRQSLKTSNGGSRSTSLTPKTGSDKRSSGGSDDAKKESVGSDNLVPFPQTGPTGSSSPSRPSPISSNSNNYPQRPGPRGRFQSDLESSTLRRPRPASYDELGANGGRRSRFESMVDLGVASSAIGNRASDLMGNGSVASSGVRDSMGSAVRKTLIIKEEKKGVTHFQIGNCIGRGQFGSVYRALNLNTGQMVAVKRIRLEGLKEEEINQLMKEVELVKRLSHPSIVKYEGMARDEDCLSIVLEYAENGSLGQTLKAFGKLNERLVASYVVKILEGLHYLHQSDVVHCDLKAANILTTKNGNVKLSDFGVSLNLRAMEREIKDVAGTPNWMAPEVIELKGASTKSDIWSLGCTVIELLTGKPPYADVGNSMSVMFRIVEDARPPLPENCSPALERFLLECFDKDPTKRPAADVLCEHEWLQLNWAGRKELRPQDSIPFLRRVSGADYQKVEKVTFAPPSIPPSPSVDQSPRMEEIISGSPPRNRRLSTSSIRPSPIGGDHDISPREHSFVKTTFSKPMVCRVCLLNVKKSAVLCSECSLIAHSKCSVNAPPTCDLRSQLLLYAQYAEKGHPQSAYHNPLDQYGDSSNLPRSPMSDVSYVARSSIDTSPPLPPPTPLVIQVGGSSGGPPSPAVKFRNAFKKPSSSRQSQDSVQTTQTSHVAHHHRPHKLEKGAKKSRETTKSANDSSVRSAATARSNATSEVGMDDARSSRVTSMSGSSVVVDDVSANVMQSIPGGLVGGTMSPRRHKKKEESKSSGNCAVQ
ncbi:Pkinase-domain-containing protein [Flagelloscypha sp. PMI_526]|nr:Pkinase-domain-containing protein [Flagelloscypha sp. PMI_526]